MKKIYLDYAATTPVDKEVLKTMLPYFSHDFGNVMSIHGFGQTALEAVDSARNILANFLGCSLGEIIFTSGATESNNLAIKGVLRSYYSQKNRKLAKPHIIITKFEHHCVLDTSKGLEKDELAEITYLPVYKDGIVKVEDIKKVIKPNTILISVMYVNNEIGTVQPIKEIGKMINEIRKKKDGLEKFYPVFHTDATQAVNYFECDVEKLGVDMMSMSGHKIYGPKGIGALYVRNATPIKRIQDGGDQENRLRAGTHNVPGIVGLGKAIKLINSQLTTHNSQQILKLRNYLIKKVLKEIPKTYLNGSAEKRSPNNANFRFDNVEGEGLVLSLDMEGIAASTGSACSSGALEPSHVLLSLGLRHEQAHGSLRLTLGKDTTKQELDITIKKLKEIVARLRKISGGVLNEFKNN
jgi:cysteine desulfurase